MFGPTTHRTWKRELWPIAVSLTVLLAVWLTGPSLGQDSPFDTVAQDRSDAPKLTLVFDADSEFLIVWGSEDLDDEPRPAPRVHSNVDGPQPAPPTASEDKDSELMMGRSGLESR